ncbi:GNAT family N-acetyltransferase [Paracoccus sp. SCSIO 75233]|uniref:GNAT family N-acetyltransferase n=1 Tax=Paracoccus sp. SCSIO 75233 TaxID=3017782 RepID=UPI0022F0736B|nr:N-acetyltransferase [Paracoccus sp. SCSIO 75233]WBU53431.1 N-acetyltransferase [Paracoccus sp. SCSIO 75233]
MQIRPEQPCDEAAISTLTTEAFAPMEHSSGTEAQIIEGLRDAGALLLSLVAVEKDAIIGHVAFSPITIDGEDHGWIGLGPVSATPGRQREGIGSALIREGLARMRSAGRKGCVLLGDPVYYQRFGFRPEPELILPNMPPEYFMALSFDGDIPQGEVAFHPAFV